MLALLVAVRMPHTAWQKLAVPMLVALLPLMFIALHPSAGSSLYGASRWIDLGPVTLQPSEFMKLAVVAFAATVLTKKWGRLDDPGHLLVPLAPVVVGVALIVILQRDLGTTVIICGSVFVLLFVAGVRLRYLRVDRCGRRSRRRRSSSSARRIAAPGSWMPSSTRGTTPTARASS